MKSTGIIVLAGLLISTMSHSAEIKTVSKIKGITVFTSGAQVFREASKYLKPGRQTLVFSNLAQQINNNSIQVGGRGNAQATILSVSYRRNFLQEVQQNSRVKTLQDSIKWLDEKLSETNNSIWIYNSEKDLLLKNKMAGSKDYGTSTEDLIKRANFFRSRMTNIFDELSKVQKVKVELSERKNAIQRQINELTRGRKQIGEILVEVDVKKGLTYSFDISYTLSQAGWYPVYDIRANDIKNPINLNYNAKVYQSTGVDWKNIELTLATSAPLQFTRKPVFSPWRLIFTPDYRNDKMKHSNRKYEYSSARGNAAVEEDAEMGAPPVMIAQNQTSTQFKIKTKYSVPSDGKKHSVSVAEHVIPATYTYYVAAKQDKKAYLLARTTDWYKYNFLPGSANIFFENTFVGNSRINLQGARDTMDISLGVDRGLIVDRKRIEDYCKSKTFGANKKETIGIQVSIVNNRSSIAEIEVVDQIPISGDNYIKVDLEDSGKAKYDEKTGRLLWNIKLKAGELKLLTFKYTVEYPKDKRINM